MCSIASTQPHRPGSRSALPSGVRKGGTSLLKNALWKMSTVLFTRQSTKQITQYVEVRKSDKHREKRNNKQQTQKTIQILRPTWVYRTSFRSSRGTGRNLVLKPPRPKSCFKSCEESMLEALENKHRCKRPPSLNAEHRLRGSRCLALLVIPQPQPFISNSTLS